MTYQQPHHHAHQPHPTGCRSWCSADGSL